MALISNAMLKTVFDLDEMLAVPELWPATMTDWFKALLASPIATPSFTSQEWHLWIQAIRYHGLAPLLYRRYNPRDLHQI